MHFLMDRKCNNGENHTTKGDCRAKVPIHIFQSRSVQVGRHTADFDLPLSTVRHLVKYTPTEHKCID